MYIYRNIMLIILELLKDFKIVSINGPRQSGKTTLSKEIANNLNMDYYTFDDESIKNTAQNNPKLFIEHISKKPSVIDEIQMVPEVVTALKMVVDNQNREGMFLLTGSADIFKISTIKESLAGRMVSTALYPFSYFEINSCKKNIIDLLFSKDILSFDFKNINFEELVEKILIGGFPAVQNKSQHSIDSWFESYIEARVEKDLSLIKRVSRENKSEITKRPPS